MIKKRRKKRSKVRYKNVKFKLSSLQLKIIDRYCKKNDTTRNKLIKKAVKDYLAKYPSMLEEENFVSENQLQLFADHKSDQKPELDFKD